jgi:hypothetical protein
MKKMRKPTLNSAFSDAAVRIKPKLPHNSDEDLEPTAAAEPKRHPGKLSRFFQRGSSSLSNLAEYFSQFHYKHKHETSKLSIVAFYGFKYLIVFPLSIYNIVFIPLQMGFNYKYTETYLALEIVTILAYVADLVLIIRQYLHLRREKFIIGTPSDSLEIQLKTSYDRDEIEEMLRNVRFDMILSLLSLFPFSLIFS